MAVNTCQYSHNCKNAIVHLAACDREIFRDLEGQVSHYVTRLLRQSPSIGPGPSKAKPGKEPRLEGTRPVGWLAGWLVCWVAGRLIHCLVWLKGRLAAAWLDHSHTLIKQKRGQATCCQLLIKSLGCTQHVCQSGSGITTGQGLCCAPA